MSKHFKDVERLAGDLAQMVGMSAGNSFFEAEYTIERTFECVKSEKLLELFIRLRDALENMEVKETKENPDQLTLF